MRIRHWLMGTAIVAGVSITATTLSSAFSKEPAPPGLAAAEVWMPASLSLPQAPTGGLAAVARSDPWPYLPSPASPPMVLGDATPPDGAPPLSIWSRKVASGETLDALLAEAGLAAADRAEVALALGAEFDLRRLQPGHAVNIISTPEGLPRLITLDIDDGVRIEVVFGDRLAALVTAPEPEIITLAREARIVDTLSGAIEDSGMPARFAVDLAQMLAGTVDVRLELSGDETLRLLWREARDGEDLVGQPELAFAALDLGDALYEVAWPEDGTGRATIYLDGEVLRVFSQPVDGARLSSVFGRRVHPVYGNVRMHTGVDFAAPHGTSVRATAPGRIAFIGRRGGYGRVVEIGHGSETMTRYAHLSAVPDGLAVGQRVTAGDMIGRVGATGTATGPNLHYEVLVEGRPTDPLSGGRLAEAAERIGRDEAALGRLTEVRALLDDALAGETSTDTTERL